MKALSRLSGFSFASSRAALLALSVVVAAPMVACGGGESQTAASVPKSAPMPDGESWSGVYFHPVFGYLHLVETGTNVAGRWKRADESAWGELEGTFEGNLLRYKWTEHKINLVGAAASSHGTGWFQYLAPQDEKATAELDGKFGLADGPEDADWHSVKQLRMSPDLESITGESPDGSSENEAWQ